MARKKTSIQNYGQLKNAYTFYYEEQFFEHFNGESGVNKLLSKHRSNLYAAIDKIRSPVNIETLEREYNNRIQKQIDAFKDFFNLWNNETVQLNKENKSILQKMLNAMSITSPDIIKEILTHLRWNDSLGTFQYSGTKLAQQSEGRAKLIRLGDVKEYRYIATILKRINGFITDLDMFSQEQKKIYLPKLIKIKQGLLETQATGEELEELEKQIIQDKQKLFVQKNPKGEIIEMPGTKIFQDLQAIKAELEGVESLNTTMSQVFAELMGAFVADEAPAVAKQEIDKVLSDFLKKAQGKTTTSANKTMVHYEKAPTLSQKVLKRNYQQLGGKGSGITNSKDKYSLTVVGASRFGKADAEFKIEHEGAQHSFGISIKNYNLYKQIDKRTGELIKATGNISLQNSSLLLYLQGAEDAFNIPQLTQYYLNIFANQAKSIHKTNLVKTDSIFNLKLNILYSSLTGGAQGRIGQQSSILAVYEKSSAGAQKRVKLFDMATILDNFELNPKLASFSPNIKYPLFDNKWEAVANTPGISEEGAIRRATQVLIDAHNLNIKTSLVKKYLT